MRGLFMVLLTTGLPFTSCIDRTPDGRVCTDLFAYGVSAQVTDAVTGQPITNATLTLRDGDYTEVMQAFPTGDFVGAGERPGTYTLTIDVPGATSDTVTGIVVRSDECHVIGVALDVRVESGRITVTARDIACTMEYAYGVSATVTSAADGRPITNATLTLTEGAYSEVMQAFPTGDYVGAGERPGTYTLTVEAPGFVTKVVNDVVVTANLCHVNGVHLNVQLQPAP